MILDTSLFGTPLKNNNGRGDKSNSFSFYRIAFPKVCWFDVESVAYDGSIGSNCYCLRSDAASLRAAYTLFRANTSATAGSMSFMDKTTFAPESMICCAIASQL